jgi:hypothetical protein
VVIRRALALLAVGTTLACNAIIGLSEPKVTDDAGVQLEAGEPSESGEESGNEASSGTDGASGQNDGTVRPDTFAPEDASDARDSTLGDTSVSMDAPQSGDATMGGSALLYVVNAAQLPGIVICIGRGQQPDGSDTTVGSTLPYPTHELSPPMCVPQDCAGLNLGCGLNGDGCGGVLNCGMCSAPEICGGGGVPSQCGGLPEGSVCQPLDCTQQGVSCGPVGDGCGNLIQCGACMPPMSCVDGACGFHQGGGGLLPGTGQPGPEMATYANEATTAFLIPAAAVMPGMTCDMLIGPKGYGGILPPGQFYRAGTAPSGAFRPGTTTLVAFWGCPPGVGDPVHCGPSFNLDAGDLTPFAFSQSTAGPMMVPANAISVQVANIAPALDCSDAGCGPTADMSLMWPGNMTGLPLMFAGVTPPLALNGFVQDASTVIIANPMQTSQTPTTLSFDDIARASNDGSTTTADGGPYFAGGQGYVLVVVGDPSVSPDASPTAALHVIGVPLSFQPDPQP